jgi:hypothetical protein
MLEGETKIIIPKLIVVVANKIRIPINGATPKSNQNENRSNLFETNFGR